MQPQGALGTRHFSGLAAGAPPTVLGPEVYAIVPVTSCRGSAPASIRAVTPRFVVLAPGRAEISLD